MQSAGRPFSVANALNLSLPGNHVHCEGLFIERFSRLGRQARASVWVAPHAMLVIRATVSPD